MRYKDFSQRVKDIESQRFVARSEGVLSMGIERCQFLEAQVKTLIQLANAARLPTATKRKLIWEKRLKRLEANRLRFQALMPEIPFHRQQLQSGRTDALQEHRLQAP